MGEVKEIEYHGKFYRYPPAYQNSSPTVAGHDGYFGLLEAVIERAIADYCGALEFFDTHPTKTKRNAEAWSRHEMNKATAEWFFEGKGVAFKIMNKRARLTPHLIEAGKHKRRMCPNCESFIAVDRKRPYCKSCGQNLNFDRIGGAL